MPRRATAYDSHDSDNRLSPSISGTIPSLFITHQLHYHLPLVAWPFELAAVQLNGWLFGKYDRVIVPDNPPGPTSLAGKLSRADTGAIRKKVCYAGILTSAEKRATPKDLDYLFVISGPEPQRTELERILLPQIEHLEGTSAVLLGSPGRKNTHVSTPECMVKNYATTQKKEELMNRARCIVCRSGYTSMMELAELGKDRALFIPTPGQTEQEYLSWYYESQGLFPSTSQYSIELMRDLGRTGSCRGFPGMPGTEENVRKLYDEVLAGYLE